jgi:pSer/pThr/pTyr-binding forkhead associated (FHA) protein
MPQLVIRSGSRTAQTIELMPGTIRLGRHPANDYCFDDVTVSSHHCEIVVGNKIVQVRDLGSTNGTFIDSQPVKEAVLLPGQTLLLGAVDMAFEDVPVQITVPTLPLLQPSPFLQDGAPA